MTLLTAGCGISQSTFPHWPTWVKYCETAYKCDHVNIGGPAAGNEYIAHNVINALDQDDIDCAIIVWTEETKTDLYIEKQHILDEITTYNLRNFVLDETGHVIKTAPGWWPSSVGTDNRIKEWMQDNIYSDTYQHIQTLMCIASVQNVCRMKNIPCYMFLGYPMDLSDAEKYGIDLDMFKTIQPLEDNYHNSLWNDYSTTKKYGMVPVAGWHFNFFRKHIIPILDYYYACRQINLDKLEIAAFNLTEKCFKEGIS